MLITNIENVELTLSEGGLFKILSDNLRKDGSNEIHIKGVNSINSMSKYLKAKPATISKILKGLKSKGLINWIRISNISIFYLNPKHATRAITNYRVKGYFCHKFVLQQEHIDLFGEELFELFSHTIEDKDFLERYEDLLRGFDKQVIAFNLTPSERYLVVNEVLKSTGIYILYDKEEIVYIGKSYNIRSRVSNHKSDKVFTSVKSLLFKDNSNVDLYEPYLINKYRPKYNKEFNTGGDMIELPEIKLGEVNNG